MISIGGGVGEFTFWLSSLLHARTFVKAVFHIIQKSLFGVLASARLLVSRGFLLFVILEDLLSISLSLCWRAVFHSNAP
jgi:hypothetical protein